MDLVYIRKSFEDLTKEELYRIIQLRIEVFVIEQNCPYQDLDSKDQHCLHLMGKDNAGNIHTYSRLVPESISYKGYTSIGRVISSSNVRGQGAGIELMEKSMIEIKKLWPNTSVKISAQSHLQRFYRRFGFVSVGEQYLEDDIHIAMVAK